MRGLGLLQHYRAASSNTGGGAAAKDPVDLAGRHCEVTSTNVVNRYHRQQRHFVLFCFLICNMRHAFSLILVLIGLYLTLPVSTIVPDLNILEFISRIINLRK
jgi:hypothetical protein